ncbi:hypothetical protein ACNRWW_09770 [Metabacillus sp. HB246100]
MDKFYCVRCMQIADNRSKCSYCGNVELKTILITVHDQETKHSK